MNGVNQRGWVMTALGWPREFGAVRPGRNADEWLSACPVCREGDLLIRELDDPLMLEDVEATRVMVVCPSGCPERQVNFMLRRDYAREMRRGEAERPVPRPVPLLVAPTALDHLRPVEYVPALTGQRLRFRKVVCPFHEGDGTPSLHCYDRFWLCFGCYAGGSIIDFGAHLYNITPRGKGYWDIRRSLVRDLRLPDEIVAA